MVRHLRISGLLSGWVLCLLPLAGFSQETQYFYHYFKEPIPLQLNREHVAVRARGLPDGGGGVAANAMGQRLAKQGFVAAAVGNTDLGRWALLDARGARAQAARARGAVQGAAPVAETVVKTVAADPDVEFASPVFVNAHGFPMMLTEGILVGFRPEADPNTRLAIIAAAGDVKRLEAVGAGGNCVRLEMSMRDGFEVLNLANQLVNHPAVAYAEPDLVFTGETTLIPTDPQFSTCWGLRNTGQSGGLSGFDMNAHGAWDINTGDSAVIVVVLDNGIEQNHPDLNQRSGHDVTDQSASNPNGGPYTQWDHHGTAVAGCISGMINNGLGGAGVAPGVRVASVRTFKMVNSSQWTSQSSWTVNALAWALSIGAKVTCNSNGYGFTSAAIDEAYQNTYSSGIIHFAAAGNSGAGTVSYPASIPVVNAVAASNRDGTRASFSQYGTGLDFIAPGQSILTTDRTGTDGYNAASGSAGDYATVNGTSFATPYAAGVAALVLSEHPTWTPAQVEAAMQATALDMGTSGYDTGYGWGHLNALGAVSFVPVTVRADFNADGKADLVFYNTSTGQISIWLMNGTSFGSSVLLPGPSLTVQPRGTGDFNGDNKTDLILFNSSTGQRIIWLMNGTTLDTEVILPGANTDWWPSGSGDFNADGKSDLIFYNVSTGQRSIWLMDGTTVGTAFVLPGANLDWHPRGAGDFNNDGKDDLLFYNVSTGQRSIWLMDGTTFSASVVQPGANTAWLMSGADDFNGDGKADLVYYNVSTGQRSIWLMNSTTFSSSVVQPGANPVWTIRNF